MTDNKEHKYTVGYILNNSEVKNREMNRKNSRHKIKYYLRSIYKLFKNVCFFFRNSTEFSSTNSSQNHEGTTIKYNDTQTDNISKCA